VCVLAHTERELACMHANPLIRSVLFWLLCARRLGVCGVVYVFTKCGGFMRVLSHVCVCGKVLMVRYAFDRVSVSFVLGFVARCSFFGHPFVPVEMHVYRRVDRGARGGRCFWVFFLFKRGEWMELNSCDEHSSAHEKCGSWVWKSVHTRIADLGLRCAVAGGSEVLLVDVGVVHPGTRRAGNPAPTSLHAAPSLLGQALHAPPPPGEAPERFW